MAIGNGTLMRAHVQGGVVNCEIQSTVRSSFPIDRTACKDNPNGGGKAGSIEAGISGEALWELSPAAKGGKDLFILHHDKTEFAADWIQSEAGGMTVSCATCLLNNIEATGGTEENGTFSFEISFVDDYTIT